MAIGAGEKKHGELSQNEKEEIKKNNIPASISNTAGTFVCNHVMYGLLYNIEKSSLVKKGGFIHVPFNLGTDKIFISFLFVIVI